MNNYEGHMDNNKGEWKQGREVGRAGVVGRSGREGRKLYLNNNKKNLKKEREIKHFSYSTEISDEILIFQGLFM